MKTADEVIHDVTRKHAAGEKADRLSLASRGLTRVPDRVWDMTWLKTLTLDGNPLTRIDERVGGLTALRTLSAESTKLTSLPLALSELPELQKVSLRYTEIAKRPETFVPPRLKELFLDAMELTALPPSLGNIKTLRKLWLWRFFEIDDEIVAGFVSSIGRLSSVNQAGFLQGRLERLPVDLAGREAK